MHQDKQRHHRDSYLKQSFQTLPCHQQNYPLQQNILIKSFDAHYCHMGTAMKHPVPDLIKQSFVIFDIRALWRSALSVRVPRCQKLQMTA